MDFKENITSLKAFLKSCHSSNGIIDVKMAKLAFGICKFFKVNNEVDCYVFCAASNLMNTYVKQSYAVKEYKKKYTFKYFVAEKLKKILSEPIENIEVGVAKGSGNCVMFNVAGLQFSFHNAFTDTEFFQLTKNCKVMNWEGLRLQPHSEKIFENALKQKGLSEENIEFLNAFANYKKEQENAEELI